ncbi:hypothetical protein EMIHUDRAFT_435374 [Emiliania huxleyi CCMP1516]|uniref:Fe2OG dioxygenase domain-containing protein n=3 Tax=Emiliania huxleyi TaxID=2903 RepID=A0A0D3JM35_EMIH1|nr:hypothetical protein EMIHUDRAFT_435374 [Emiliania huxleyi CCMP1516]EOD24570.1 hypothetical protein EMIHUDRAFT_435374 [Emiliania huxleyi CCMP1516]|eukprot:XP_005776999.1 hypothetical protein EMIHUDRAFT_435374 [Emiliania huxleyi CCMP1516]
MLELGRELLQWIDEHMDAATREQLRTNNVTRLAETLDPTNTMMRILRYPPYDPELAAPGATRASAHEDINLITLLPSGSARGLELRDHRTGEWREVPLVPEALIINIGDMLEQMSNGEYRATSHRVVVPADEDVSSDRMSIPTFLHPFSSTYLSPKYATADAFLTERLIELGVLTPEQVAEKKRQAVAAEI